MRPLRNNVFVRPIKEDEITPGGIILLPELREEAMKGEIVFAGPGTKARPMTVKAGDKVKYSKYAGSEHEIEGEILLLMSDGDILVIL